MITTPQARRTDATAGSDPPGTAQQGGAQQGGVPQAPAEQGSAGELCPHGCTAVARTVTAEQVDQAVAQLRERPGRSAVEQVQSVIRAFDLTVVPPLVIPDQR